MSETSLDALFNVSSTAGADVPENGAPTEPGLVDLDLPDVAAADGLKTVGSYAEERRAALDAFERTYVKAVLACTGGNVSAAARIAKIDRVYLHRLMRRHHTTRTSIADAAE